MLITDDGDHYFEGRIIIDKKRLNLLYNEFTLTITCNPYRYILPTLSEVFSDIELENPSSESERIPYHLGRYCGAVSVSYEASGTASGKIYIYKDNELTETHELSAYAYYDELLFGVDGDVEISFKGLSRISLNGQNMEV